MKTFLNSTQWIINGIEQFFFISIFLFNFSLHNFCCFASRLFGFVNFAAKIVWLLCYDRQTDSIPKRRQRTNRWLYPNHSRRDKFVSRPLGATHSFRLPKVFHFKLHWLFDNNSPQIVLCCVFLQFCWDRRFFFLFPFLKQIQFLEIIFRKSLTTEYFTKRVRHGSWQWSYEMHLHFHSHSSPFLIKAMFGTSLKTRFAFHTNGRIDGLRQRLHIHQWLSTMYFSNK